MISYIQLLSLVLLFLSFTDEELPCRYAVNKPLLLLLLLLLLLYNIAIERFRNFDGVIKLQGVPPQFLLYTENKMLLSWVWRED